MTMSDPIADMLTRIRNANTAKHDTVDVIRSCRRRTFPDDPHYTEIRCRQERESYLRT